MLEIVAMAFAAAFGMIFLVLKFGKLRKILAFNVAIDVAVTSLLMFSMAGTFTGIMVAIFAGGIVSVTFYTLKKLFPPDTLTPKGWVKSSETGLIDWWYSGLKRI